METNEELKYVCYKNLTNVPFPGIKYAEKSFDLLANSVDYFEKNLRNKKYIFTLSNGKIVELEVFDYNLAHLLGILTIKFYNPEDKKFSDNIIDIHPRKRTSSYIILKKMLEKRNEIIKYEYDNGNKNVNFYRISIRSNAFKEINNLDNFSFGIINFDANLYEKINKHNTKIKSNKLITFPFNQEQNGRTILGAKKNKEYILETVIVHTPYHDFISGQTIAFPIKIEKVLKNGEKEISKEITPCEKIELLKLYKELILECKKEIILDKKDFLKVLI